MNPDEDIPNGEGVYLIHFDTPLPRGTSRAGVPLFAYHYLGYSEHIAQRIQAHRNGNGSRLMEVVKERGIGWRVARTWEGYTRKDERRMKNWKKISRHCPVCQSSRKEKTP